MVGWEGHSKMAAVTEVAERRAEMAAATATVVVTATVAARSTKCTGSRWLRVHPRVAREADV